MSENEFPEDELIEFEQNATDELALAKQEIADLKDKHLRAVAELQNMQRRNQRDVEDATKYGVTSAAKPLLTVSDNLHRALEAVPKDLPDNIQTLFEGIRATERSLQQALEKMGVVAIAAKPGQALNPHEHEVMFEVDSTDYDHGHIVQVLEAGYKIHDRLLRPTRVSVAKNANGVADKTVDLSA
jgi:molecular chaperone GrpE